MENLLDYKEAIQSDINSICFVETKIIEYESTRLNKVFLLSLEKIIEIIDKDPNCTVDKIQLSNYFISNSKLRFPNHINKSLSEDIILIMLGFINDINKNAVSNLFRDMFDSNLPYNCFFSKNFNLPYSEYINNVLDYLSFKDFDISDLINLRRCTSEMGLTLCDEIFKKIEKIIYSENDKILIIIAPGDNFWFKSDIPCINYQNYERKYHGKDIYIFYNWELIKYFFEILLNHPRCRIGLVSSLTKTNLKENFDLIVNYFSKNHNFNPKEIFLFDEETHDIENEVDLNTNQISYKRNINKIIENIGKEFKVSEEKILFLESEEKKCVPILDNTIMMNCFSEEILKSDASKERIKKLVEYLINYIINMLESNSIIDIPQYLRTNPFFIRE